MSEELWDGTIAVLGAGPHGRQIAAWCEPLWPVLYDDDLPGYPRISAAVGRALIGAAWPHVRRQIAERVPAGVVWYQRESPAPAVAVGSGSIRFRGAQIGHGVVIGAHTHIGFNAVIAHESTIGDFVQICPGALICGQATVEDDVFVGAGAVVVHGGITIGRGAVVGAGSVVLEDVPAGATVVGNPARVLASAVRP